MGAAFVKRGSLTRSGQRGQEARTTVQQNFCDSPARRHLGRSAQQRHDPAASVTQLLPKRHTIVARRR
jgi:hypothetical protein